MVAWMLQVKKCVQIKISFRRI